jgi:hypothetical protein
VNIPIDVRGDPSGTSSKHDDASIIKRVALVLDDINTLTNAIGEFSSDCAYKCLFYPSHILFSSLHYVCMLALYACMLFRCPGP